MNNSCKLVNVVWIERGILLVMIHCVLKRYTKLLNRIIIIDNDRYREFMKILFPSHNFQKYSPTNKSDPNNFYFNVRKIIQMQDIIIDYVSNLDQIVYTKKIDLVPWYDMNDMLVYYKFDPNVTLNVSETVLNLKFFSKCTRGNFKGNMWDIHTETNILTAYASTVKSKKISVILQSINKFLLDEYTDTSVKTNTNNFIQRPQIYYIPTAPIVSAQNKPAKPDNSKELSDTIKKMEIHNEEILNGLIELISNKLKLLNDID